MKKLNNSPEIVRKIIKMKGYNQTLLAEKAGFKSQSNVGELLRGRNMRVDNLVRMLDALDCDLVVRSRTYVRHEGDPSRGFRPEFTVKLTESEEEEL